jgi:HEAT repeat protein
VRANSIRAIGEILSKERLKTLVPVKETFEAVLNEKDPSVLERFHDNENMLFTTLSILTRAVPLDYSVYNSFSFIPSSKPKKQRMREFNQYIYNHLPRILPMIKRWIMDIRNSEEYAESIMYFLVDPSPFVRKSVAYSLGQMKFDRAISSLVSLLNDRNLWVRDAAMLSLTFFKDKGIDTLRNAMVRGDPAFRILAVDVLARINSEKALGLLKLYKHDPNDDVKRMVMNVLAKGN